MHSPQPPPPKPQSRPRAPHPSRQLLSAFVDVLRALAVALGQLLPTGGFHPVAYTLERLAGEYKARFATFNASFAGPPRAGS